MNTAELKEFMADAMRPMLGAVKALTTSLSRHAETRILQASATLRYGSASFRYVLQRTLVTRVLGAIGRSTTSAPLQAKRPLAEFDGLTLEQVAQHVVAELWDEYQTLKKAYDPQRHPADSDPWLRARIAHYAVLGVDSKEALEEALRRDLKDNWATIAALDEELARLRLRPTRHGGTGDVSMPETRRSLATTDVRRQTTVAGEQ